MTHRPHPIERSRLDFSPERASERFVAQMRRREEERRRMGEQLDRQRDLEIERKLFEVSLAGLSNEQTTEGDE